jgi:hypothetical protein
MTECKQKFRNLEVVGRERKKVREGSERHYIGGGGGARYYNSGFEGSQAVPACPSGIGNAY